MATTRSRLTASAVTLALVVTTLTAIPASGAAPTEPSSPPEVAGDEAIAAVAGTVALPPAPQATDPARLAAPVWPEPGTFTLPLASGAPAATAEQGDGFVQVTATAAEPDPAQAAAAEAADPAQAPETAAPDTGGEDQARTPQTATPQSADDPEQGTSLEPGTPEAAASVDVTVLPRQDALDAGVDGLLLSVEPAGPAALGPVQVSVTYAGFATAYGGDWATRLRLVAMPDCVLTTPQAGDCATPEPLASTNDTAAGTVTAVLEEGSFGVLALAAAPAGPAGDWSATSLTPSASWQVSTQTGDFSWSYPVGVPPTQGGPAPDLALSYSSGSIDGRVATSNSQASWVGDGWDLTSGYIERSYIPCADQLTPLNPNPTGDLCWASDNASLVFNGSATRLVKDTSVPGRDLWRLKTDDGTRVERFAGGANADDDGEYWTLTTVDGTQYVFGRGAQPTTNQPLSSAWTVPVYGNDAGEPCNAATFGTSWCRQGWRWNLDYVVDTSGNSLTYFYDAETNHYQHTGPNGPTVSAYDRGGYLKRIDYGQRAGAEGTAAPQRVEFEVAERCDPDIVPESPGFDCLPSSLNAATAIHWPDVPFDQICESDSSCPTVLAPAFFSRQRLTSITTQIRSGSEYTDVAHWELVSSYKKPGDSTSPILWLDAIRRPDTTGETTDPELLPDVRFTGTQLANRVDTLGDEWPAMNRWRVTAIISESGGRTSVNYLPKDCAVGDTPSDPQTNTRRCFPVKFPDFQGNLVTEYFHKYLVSSVVADAGDSLPVETHYSYLGDPAWHFDDNLTAPDTQRTWGQFRGYATVEVTTGAPSAQVRSQVRYEYFRGMGGDPLGTGIDDVDRLNGFLRRQTTLNGAGGPVISTQTYTPWVSPATAGTGDLQSRYLGVAVSETTIRGSALPEDGRTTRTVTSYDSSYGMPYRVEDQGDPATTDDDRCTRLEYARNTAANILATVRRVETVSVPCATTAAIPEDVVALTRTHYDGGGFGATPTRGLATTTQQAVSYTGTSPVFANTVTTYDANGRPTSVADAEGRTTTTTYIPATGGPVTGTTITSPDPDGTGPLQAHVTTTTVDPAWGAPTRVQDPNGKVTTATYDALGRITSVTLPEHAGLGAASVTYDYVVSNTQDRSNAVATHTLYAIGQDGQGRYRDSVQVYDRLLRPRQTRAPSADRQFPDYVVVSDTFYDTRGLLDTTFNSWVADRDVPAWQLLTLKVDDVVPSRTVYEYDGAGRQTRQALYGQDLEDESALWETTTSYDGDRVTTDPPAGGVAQTVITNARGQVAELRQYASHDPTGTSYATTYDYDPAGRLSGVTDAAGNQWTYGYDLLGRQTSSTDPDKGQTTSTYDKAGQLLSATDARDVTLAYTYDALGRRTSERDTATGQVLASWAYDTLAKGQLTSATRYPDGPAYVTAVTGYDDAYRPRGQSVTIPAVEGPLAGTYTTSYTYTLDGQVETTTLPGAGNLAQETVRTYFDDLGLAEWMSSGRGWGTYVAASSFSALGEVEDLRLGNLTQTQVSYTYDPATRRLTGTNVLRMVRTMVNGVLTLPAGDDVQVKHVYDPAGNRTQTQTTTRTTGGAVQVDTQCYSYDGLARLASAWTPANGNCGQARSVAALGGPAPYWIDYTTNAIGNRTSQVTHTAAGNTTTTYTYPAATTGQPHAVSSTTTTGPAGTTTATYAYDDTGNTETRTGADGSVQDLVWDAEGRLASAGPEETGSAFVYTAGGDRLIRREGGATANPAPPQVSDDFDRTVTSGWGSADIGGPWTTTTPGKFAVNGQVGTMSVAAGATVKTWLGDLVWTSADVQATVSTDKAPAGSGPWVLVQARRVTDDLHYAARVKLNGDGTVGLHVTAGDGTAIAGGTVEGLTFTGGERLRVRVQAEGTSPTTLRAKVWAEGDPEPAVWNVEATDTTEGLQTAGTIGIRAYLPGSATNAPVGVLVDDLSATPVGAQAAAGTPATTAAATTATTAVVGPSTTVYLPGGQELRLDQSTGKVTATRYYAFAGQSVAMRTGPGGTAVTSLVSDPHGTATIAVANTTAATLTVRRFDPYANPRGPQVTWPGDHGFLDKPVDATGLVAIGARYYDPALGRFISVDPVMDLTDPQQWAAYSYANNNPTTYSDPTGLIVCGDFEGAGACNRRHQSAGAGAGGGGGGDPRPAAPSPPVCVRTSYGCVGGAQPGSSRRSTPAAPVDHLAVNASSPEQIAYNTAWNEANIQRILPEQSGFQQWAWDAGQWVNRGSQLLLLWTAAGGTLPGANRLGRVRPNPTPTPAPDPPPRGGARPVEQGAAGVQRTIDDLEAAGGKVLGREVTVEAGGVRTRPDLFVELPCGSRCFLEVKTGPGAQLTPNQAVGFPAIRSGGAVPVGGNAAAAGLKLGSPMDPTPVWIVRQPWPLDL